MVAEKAFGYESRDIQSENSVAAFSLFLGGVTQGRSDLLRFTRPPIHIIQPHDIVLTEVAADVHLDQFEGDFSWIGEPMHASNRNLDGLVFVDCADLRVDRDLGRTHHYYPMLGAVEMLPDPRLGGVDLLGVACLPHRDMVTPRRMGPYCDMCAALHPFSPVGIASEDDLDAPDLGRMAFAIARGPPRADSICHRIECMHQPLGKTCAKPVARAS